MEKQENSIPIKGMNRDNSIDRLREGEFIFAMNADNNGDITHNEPSNYLNVNFPNGYKVIGLVKNNLLGETYYILTNPTTLKSSIGYVKDFNTFHTNDDPYEDCIGCGGVESLSPAKETITETAENTYIEYINDICLPANVDLNLRITNPIKSLVIKNEQSGTIIYWEDDRNLPRWMNVSDISYLFEVDVPCDDPQVTRCPQIKKLLQFPEHTSLTIQPVSINVGGTLRMGSYEFYGAYCDIAGNETSEYSTGTNPIKIFDKNNRQLETNQLDLTTNYAIKLQIDDLDTTFKYYRIVCIERGVLNSEQVAFEVGIYPTTQDTILYTSSGRYYTNTDRSQSISPKKSVEISDIFIRKPRIEKAKGEAIIGGRKYIHGVKRREEINIQPVVNLFSSLLQWQTVISTENLYKDATLASNYGSYMRDEVHPFSMRLLYKDGGKSSNFLFIARPPRLDEIVDVSKEDFLVNIKEGCQQTDRTKKWQFFNTAKVTNQCTELTQGTEISQSERRTCEIEEVKKIPPSNIEIDIEGNFTDLITYIKDNPDAIIPGITNFLTQEYPAHCTPLFGTIATEGDFTIGRTYKIDYVNIGDDFSNVGFLEEGELFVATANTPINWTNGTEVEETVCGYAVLEDSYNKIEKINGEVISKVEAIFPTEYDKLSSTSCNFYVTASDGSYEKDLDFMYLYMFKSLDTEYEGYVARKRNYTFTNEGCPSSEPIQFLETSPNVQRYYFRLAGAVSRGELESTNKFSTSQLDAQGNGFSGAIQETALWFKANVQQRQKFLLEVSKTGSTPSGANEELTGTLVNPQQKVRISLFNRCSDQTAFYSEILPIKSRGARYLIERTSAGLNIVDDQGITHNITINNPLPSNSFYVAVDPWVNKWGGLAEDDCDTCENGYNINSTTIVSKWRTAPPEGCFGVVLREVQYTKAKISWSSIILNKVEEYISQCTYLLPDNIDCEPIAYQQGDFSYWESVRTYPDNKDLYDSSILKVSPSDLNAQTYKERKKFEDYYTKGLNAEGDYNHKVDVITNKPISDFRCEPIRHFKMPDNRVTPFMASFKVPNDADSYIYPLGVHLSTGVVESMLKVSVKNGLITQAESDNVYGFEILRGDNTYSRSIVSNGIAFDMFKYKKDNRDYFYSNFPYNDLGSDQYNLEKRDGTLIKHPFNGTGNNKFTYISPDLTHTRTTLPTEMTLQGYVKGNSKTTFTELEKHAKWTILGSKARNTANILAIAEAILEIAIKIGDATSRQWFTIGTSSGTSLGLVGVGIIAASSAINGFVNIGKYRYEWLSTFRNLGSMDNFAYYAYSHGKYNSFLINSDRENYIKSISVNKYLPSGDFSLLDQKSGETYNINNFLREDSVFFSLGKDFLEYLPNYAQIDNSNIKNNSSKSISSSVGCDVSEFSSDIGSPYITMKNYVPDQFGEVESVTWLTTNKVFKRGENNSCEGTFGGGTSITRYTEKRKIPFFRRTAFGGSDKTAYEYSTAANIGFPRFYCDYETDTQYDGLLIPMPDIDSDYNFDCLTTSNRFYIKPAKFYTAYFSVVDFLVESDMNLNYRYGGKEMKDQFYPLITDLNTWTQEKNLSITEPNTLRYANVFSLPVSYSNTRILPYSYDREFYKKLSKNVNEVIWSEIDNSETNNLNDPYLTYRPFNSFSFNTSSGELKSLKESVKNQAIARFTNGMSVFNTIDVLAERVTPQTQALGTGGIFAQKPVEFIKNSLGFTGTQHYNVIETEFGDAHVDSERGQIIFVNNQGTSIQDMSYLFEGEPTNMSKWFKKNLPFKIKRTLPNVDIDNPFIGVGISGGYDNTNKRMFLTKLDYIPKKCVEFTENGFVFNQTDCEKVAQIPTCPEGYSYNEPTQTCVKEVAIPACPEGYVFDPLTNTCTIEDSSVACNDGYNYNPRSGMCEKVLTVSKECGTGFTYNPLTNLCEKLAQPTIACPVGFVYNTFTGKCEKNSTETLDLIIITDRSGSVDPTEKILMNNFNKGLITSFDSRLTTDNIRVGLVDFAFASMTKQTLSNSKTTLLLKADISPSSDPPPFGIGGSTNIVSGIINAFIELNNNGRVGSKKKIVLFVDGNQNINVPLDTIVYEASGGNPATMVRDYLDADTLLRQELQLNSIPQPTNGVLTVTIDGTSYSIPYNISAFQTLKDFQTTHNAGILANHGVLVPNSIGNSSQIKTVQFVKTNQGFPNITVTQTGDLVTDLKDIVVSGVNSTRDLLLGFTKNLNTGKNYDITLLVTGISQYVKFYNNASGGIQIEGVTYNIPTGSGFEEIATAFVNTYASTAPNAVNIIKANHNMSVELVSSSPANSRDIAFISLDQNFKKVSLVVGTNQAFYNQGEVFEVLNSMGGLSSSIIEDYPISSPSDQGILYNGNTYSTFAATFNNLQSISNILSQQISATVVVDNLCDGCAVIEGMCNCTETASATCPINYSDAGQSCIKILQIDTNCTDNCNVIIEGMCGCDSVEQAECPPGCVLMPSGQCDCEVEVEPTYIDSTIPITVADVEYFKNVSWTVSFKFERKGWNSYFSFFPNYYNTHQDFFQTGYNNSISKLYSHTLENSSFQVFGGKLHPFIIESIVTNKGQNKMLSNISINTEAQRYQNDWDYSVWEDKGFNKLNVYNQTNNSGQLRIEHQKTLSDIKKYPKTNGDNTQTILFSAQDERQKVNYFFNRVRNQERNMPQWIWDENMINKLPNDKVVNFTHLKKVMERLRGDSFVIRLENDKESGFKINLKDVTQDINYQV